MQISFDRFLALTMTIAAGASLSLGCVVEPAADDDGASGGKSSTGGNTDAGNTEAGAAGQVASTAGAAGSAGSVEGAAGAAGSVSASAGTAGTAAPSVEGNGGAPSSEGSGGTPSSEGTGASAGAAGTPSSEGSGGTPSSEGTGASAGAAGTPSSEGSEGTCLSSDPAEEGMGVDCSVLPYYDQSCPNPSGEGYMSPLGVAICWQYSSERTESARVLTDCLIALEVTAEGYCGAEHEAAVDACVAEMEQQTCPSAVAVDACASINASCSAVGEAECVAHMSVLADATVNTFEPCAIESSGPSSICEHVYRQCSGNPDRFISVQDACAEVKAGCVDMDASVCETQIDVYGGGALYESTFYTFVVGCMQTEQEASSVDCTAAFETCTSGWVN